MNLRLSDQSAHEAGETDHPQLIMKKLGITYQHATPQSISSEWWFWNCEGMPATLPPYLTELTVEPHEAIGWGLSAEMADSLAAGRSKPIS